MTSWSGRLSFSSPRAVFCVLGQSNRSAVIKTDLGDATLDRGLRLHPADLP